MLKTQSPDEDLEAHVDAYRDKLRQEMGAPVVQHYKRPRERRFVASERPHSTVIYFGLTQAHEDIALGAFERMGYSVKRLPVPDNAAYELGREYCNRGQCNPTYYIVGNLLKFLFQERERGLSIEEIEDRYVLAWGADCGPCRMGMYEADLRKALKDAGFPNFRIANLDISNGLDVDQSEEDDGLQLKPLFFLNLAKAMMAADILNDITNKIRPYEVNPGDTDKALEQAKTILHEAGTKGKSVVGALRRARKVFESIEVDYLRVKPRAKITGEFWAKLTPGEGNYRLRSWLEEEGAEVMMDPVGAWFEYMIWLNDMKVRDRMGIQPDARGLGNANPWLILAGLHLGKVAYEAAYNFYRALLDFKADPLPNMRRLDQYAQGYYTRQSIAGEGHLEITKHIMSMREEKAHMMISVKPFGCMPSTISDGVQAKLTTDFGESVFVAVETNADGEVLVKSRVQMKLQEAKQKARDEFQKVLDAYGVTVDEVRAYAQRHNLMRAMRRVPHEHGVVGTAAHFVADVARRMGHRPRFSLNGNLRH